MLSWSLYQPKDLGWVFLLAKSSKSCFKLLFFRPKQFLLHNMLILTPFQTRFDENLNIFSFIFIAAMFFHMSKFAYNHIASDNRKIFSSMFYFFHSPSSHNHHIPRVFKFQIILMGEKLFLIILQKNALQCFFFFYRLMSKLSI